MRIFQSMAFLLCFTVAAFAQSGKYNNAVISLETYETSEFKDTDALLDALKDISVCAADSEWALKPKVWFVKGKVTDYIYQDSSVTGLHPKAPFDASAAFQKSLSFPNEKFSDAKLAKEMLFILSTRMYNTGVHLLQAKDDDNAYKYFKEVSNIKKFLDGAGYTETMDPKRKGIFEQTERDATYNAAICLLRMDRKTEAQAAMQELIDRGYDSPDIYRVAANFSLEASDTAKSLELLTKGIEKYPDEKGVDLRISEINVYIAQKRTDDAIAKIETAAKLLPNNPELMFVLADAYASAGKPDIAEQTYLKVAEIDPKGESAFKAYNNLGAMYIDEGNALNQRLMDDAKLTQAQFEQIQAQRDAAYSKALPFLEKALAIKPNDKQILRVLKEVYTKLGQYDKSKQMKEQLEKLGG